MSKPIKIAKRTIIQTGTTKLCKSHLSTPPSLHPMSNQVLSVSLPPCDPVEQRKKRRNPTERFEVRIKELEAELAEERLESMRYSLLCAISACGTETTRVVLSIAQRNRRDNPFCVLAAAYMRCLGLETITPSAENERISLESVRLENTGYFKRALHILVMDSSDEDVKSIPSNFL
jgi:hypothetical protein